MTIIVIVVQNGRAGQVGQDLPLASESMDIVVGTLLLCSVPDVAAVIKGATGSDESSKLYKRSGLPLLNCEWA